MPGKSTFQDKWLEKGSPYSLWIGKHAKYKTFAVCKLCNTDINLEKHGHSAVKSHSSGKKHLGREKCAKSKSAGMFFNNASILSSTTSQIEESPTATGLTCSTASISLDNFQQNKKATMDAEIRWAHKVVASHFSFRSCVDLNELFQTMAPDSEILNGFRLDKTKCRYNILYGFAPYYKQNLMSAIDSSPFYCILFDESLNEILQREQLDIHIRFWDAENQEAITRYYDSKFLRRPNAENLLKQTMESIGTFNQDRFVQLSMDGLNVNWKVLNLLNADRESNDRAKLFDIGSCGLHTVHHAFQRGVLSTDWSLDKVLRSMFNLFHDSPAR